MGIEERVHRMKRPARRSFYKWQADGYGNPRITNWRMLIARRLGISIAEVRRHLGEPPK